jgi:hypothetical protein
MASQFDDSDFIDRDFQNSQGSHSAPQRQDGTVAFRPPNREQLDTRVNVAQQKLAELKRAQEELERERTVLEEARRRRVEFQTGREEMLQHLTRGVTLLEHAEFNARRDAEQMAKSLGNLREALGQVQVIQEESWTQENWNGELTKALASIENARMEWNSARLKWTLLNGTAEPGAANAPVENGAAAWQKCSFWELCRVGAALTWPISLVALVGIVLLLIFGGR